MLNDLFVSTKPKHIFTTEFGSLYNGDCIEFMRIIPSESIDTVFADPPFKIGKEYGNGFSDKLSETEYLRWCQKWIDECLRVLKPGGSFFIYQLPKWAFKLAAYLDI